MNIEPYLFFNGDCEAAVTFYAAALGGTLGPIKRWGDMPGAQGMSAEHAARVMHVHVTAPGISFMASDGEDLAQGTSRRVVLSLGCDTVEDDAYERKFWGQHFGMLYDRFGIIWMVTGGASTGSA